MDAVAEAQTQVQRSVKEWLKDGDTLFSTAEAAGVELEPILRGSRVMRTITGTTKPRTGTTKPATRTRARTRTSTTNGTGPTAEQVFSALMALDGAGANQTQLAARFGVARQTIAHRLDRLVKDGRVKVTGTGARKMWRAAQPAGMASRK